MQAILGHARASTTLDVYSDAIARNVETAMAGLDSLVQQAAVMSVQIVLQQHINKFVPLLGAGHGIRAERHSFTPRADGSIEIPDFAGPAESNRGHQGEIAQADQPTRVTRRCHLNGLATYSDGLVKVGDGVSDVESPLEPDSEIRQEAGPAGMHHRRHHGRAAARTSTARTAANGTAASRTSRAGAR